MVCHRSTRCARRRARRPVHSTRAPPPRTAPAAKHISSQARDRIAPLTLTWRSSSLYAQLNGRNSRKMPKKSKNKTGAATNASAANKRARRAADQPHTADTTTTSTWRQPTRRSSAMCWRRCAPQALTCPPADRSRGRRCERPTRRGSRLPRRTRCPTRGTLTPEQNRSSRSTRFSLYFD